MILGSIYTFAKYRHVESKRIVTVANPDTQAKIQDNEFSPPSQWTTCVAYSPDDNSSALFVVDIDSFRRKFQDYTPGEDA